MSLLRPRRQPPAFSPLPARSLAAGLGAALSRSLAAGLGAAAGHSLRPGGGGSGTGSGGGEGSGAVARLSDRLRREYGAEEVRLTDSGTSALTLALAAAAAGRAGASVALPAYGCYDMATAAVGAGVPVVLYDLDPATLGPDPDSLAAALGRGPAAVVVAHLYGIPVDVPAVAERAGAVGALVVEDAAQGFGGRLRGRPLGGFGSLSVLSFGRGKGITGLGGGALLALDDRGREALEALERGRGRSGSGEGRRGGAGWRELAGAAAVRALGRPRLYGIPAALPFLHLGETRYRAPRPPRPIPAASAAIVDAAWEEARKEAAGRRRRAGRLVAAAEESSGWRIVGAPEGAEPGYLRVPLRARGERTRREADRSGARRRGIAPGYPAPLSELAPLRARLCGGPPEEGAGEVGDGEDGPRSRASSCEGARSLASELVTLPPHGLLSAEELRWLEGWIRRTGAGGAAPAAGGAVREADGDPPPGSSRNGARARGNPVSPRHESGRVVKR